VVSKCYLCKKLKLGTDIKGDSRLSIFMPGPNYIVVPFVMAWLFPCSTLLTTFSINKLFSLSVFLLQFSLPKIAAQGKQLDLETLPIIAMSPWTIKSLSQNLHLLMHKTMGCKGGNMKKRGDLGCLIDSYKFLCAYLSHCC
jgi:hypothetical protein